MMQPPKGWEFAPDQDVESESRRPDGVIRLQRRPFLTRLRNHYRMYTKMGLSRWGAFKAAWMLANC